MASFDSSGWPSGATVTVYARDAFGNATGSSVTSATASAAGVASFSGLADSGKYVATDGSRTVRFGTPPPGSSESSVVNATGGAADQAAIEAAVTALRVAGKLDGTIRVKGVARLTQTLQLDGGYADVTPADANWATSTPERFTLVGKFQPDAGVSRAINAHGMFGATLDVKLVGGGHRGSVTDAAITNGQSTVTSPAAVADGIGIGCIVRIAGAGPQLGIGNRPLFATVTAVDTGTNVITLNDGAAATVAAAAMTWGTVGLHVEDMVGLQLDVDAKNYAGCALHADASGDPTKRIRSQRPGVLNFNSNGWGIFWKSLEAFGSLGKVFSDNTYGDYLGLCDDIAWDHWEGGIGGAGGTNVAEVYLTLDRCNNFNPGRVALGDRATEAALVIAGGDPGIFPMIRCTGFGTASMPAAVKLLDVGAFDGRVLTKNCAKGIHVVGGSSTAPKHGIILRHRSLTNDDVSLYIEPSTTQTAPEILCEAEYRKCNAQAVYVAAGMTGGRLAIPGRIDQPNTANTAIYAIDVQSAAFVLDVTGLWQKRRTGSLLGSVNHADPTKIFGVSQAVLENPLTHGALLAAATIVGSTDYRNDGAANNSVFGRSLEVDVTFRLAPTAGAAAQVELYVGPTTAWSSTNRIGIPVAPINDEQVDVVHRFVVPPWHYYRFVLTNATIQAPKSRPL